jgi:hypothetical protein
MYIGYEDYEDGKEYFDDINLPVKVASEKDMAAAEVC